MFKALNRWDWFSMASLLGAGALVWLGWRFGEVLTLGLGLFALLFVAGFWASIRLRIPAFEQAARARAEAEWSAWQALALELGLQYQMPETRPFRPEISGGYRDHAVRLTTYRGQDENSTGLIVTLKKPTSDRFTFNRQPNRREELEKRYHLHSQPDALLEWLLASEQLRAGLMRVPPTPAQFRLREDTLSYVQGSSEQDAVYLREILDLLLDLAELIEGRAALQN